MKFSDLVKKYGAYLVAAAVFVLLAVVYCKPVLSGKVLVAADEVAAVSSQQEPINYHKETGDYSWWTGSVFSGMPNYQMGGGGTVGKVNWLGPLKKIFFPFSNPIWTIILYFICFFILLRCFGIKPTLSIVGALAIAFSSYFFVIIAAGHGSKTITIPLISVVIGAFHLIFRKHKYGVGAVLTMVFVAMGYVSHPQMTYYIYLMIALLWVAELILHIKEKQIAKLAVATAVFLGATAIGIGTSMDNVFYNAEYVRETMRGGHSDIVREDEETEGRDRIAGGLDISYATQWSYGIDETMSFMIPGFMGGANSIDVGKDSKLYRTLVDNGVSSRSAADFCKGVPMYWGDQPFTSGNVYMGAIICFLFLLGLLIVEGPYKWALLAATLFSTALAWGHNCMWLTELFFKYFPLYSKFRAVSSILIVAEIAMPLLGFLAIKQIMDGTVDRKKLFKSLYIAGGVTGGICLLFALFGGAMFSFTSQYDASWSSSLPDWVYDAIVDQRAALLRSDSFRSFLFIAAAFCLLWIYAKGRLKNVWMIAILGVLVLADMWPVDKRYFNDSYFLSPRAKNQNQYEMMPYEASLLADPDPHFRVFNLTTNTFNENRTSYYLKSIGGYSAAKLRRYQDLITEHLSKMHWPVIGMLNAKYIILPGDDGQPKVQLNPYALGNAWFVDDIVVVDNATRESDSLMEIDLSNTAVVDKSFAGNIAGFVPGHDEQANVKLTKYTPKYIDYESTSSKDGVIVFSEIYYPHGWKATIDGQPAEHFRVNYTLRALNVPAGSHKIHFVFDPDSVRKGNTFAGIFCVLMYLIAAAVIAKEVIDCRKRRQINA